MGYSKMTLGLYKTNNTLVCAGGAVGWCVATAGRVRSAIPGTGEAPSAALSADDYYLRPCAYGGRLGRRASRGISKPHGPAAGSAEIHGDAIFFDLYFT